MVVMSSSIDSISRGVDIVVKNPIIFLPSLIPIIIALIFNALAYWVFVERYIVGATVITAPNWVLLALGSFIAAICGFIAGCMVVDMVHDVLEQRKPDLSKSFSAVMGRVGVLIVLAIISAILTVIIVGIPIALFLIVVAIVEKTGVGESLSRSISFVSKNIGAVLVFVVIVIVVAIVLALIPVAGMVLSWIVNVIFTAAAVDLYVRLGAPLPPPPPPPPPA